METLINIAGSEMLEHLFALKPEDYFLTFSSKEEYLKKRDEWRGLYNLVSSTIRHNKLARKAYQRAAAKIEFRMTKKGRNPNEYVSSEDFKARQEEYRRRHNAAISGLPTHIKERDNLDPTVLLKVRGMMKVKSFKQKTGQERV